MTEYIVAIMFILSTIAYTLVGAWIYYRGRKGESPIPSVPKVFGRSEPPKPEPKTYKHPEIGA